MLKAAAKRRGRYSTKLGEDEITSCVFGPLDYLPTEQVWGLFERLIPVKKLWPKTVPNGHQCSFWQNIAKSGRVEPDLAIRFLRDARPILTVLIEVKWDTYLNPEDQLVKQWDCITQAEKAPCLHLYLVKDLTAGEKDIAKSLQISEPKSVKEHWKERLFCIGWRDLAERLNESLRFWNAPIVAWAKDVHGFLERIGVTAFSGFAHLPDPDITSIGAPPFFWREYPWFSYLEERNLPESFSTATKLFWKEIP
jgi:hypothetical protein